MILVLQVTTTISTTITPTIIITIIFSCKTKTINMK